MKKITIIATSLFLSFGAHAANVNLTETKGVISILNCSLLNEDVKINLSNSVQGGVACVDTGAANTQGVALATCHTSGRATSRTVACKGGSEGCSSNTTGTPGTRVATGPAMSAASTIAGTVEALYPSGSCTSEAAITTAGSKLTADHTAKATK